MAKRLPDCTGLRRPEAKRVRERYWREVLAEQARSGLKHSAFCRKHDLPYHTYTWWRRCLVGPGRPRRQKETQRRGSAFVPVRVVDRGREDRQGGREPALELVLGDGSTLRIPGGVPATRLREVLVALKGAVC